ncbi:MAG: hypothetical protein R2715_07325 [Ilumatobacteraceae bacterium]
MSLRTQGGWRDAFGVPGLRVDALSVALSVGGAGPSLGVAGTAVLPSAIAGPLGITSSTPITLAANIGGAGFAASCFAFEIGDGTRTAIDVLDAGAITAKRAAFVIAPTGCTSGDFVVGFSFAFDGTVFGVGLDVSRSRYGSGQRRPRAASRRWTTSRSRLSVEDVTIDLVLPHRSGSSSSAAPSNCSDRGRRERAFPVVPRPVGSNSTWPVRSPASKWSGASPSDASTPRSGCGTACTRSACSPQDRLEC